MGVFHFDGPVLPEICRFHSYGIHMLLQTVRRDVDTVWETVCKSSTAFASRHGINTEFPEERRRAKKRMPGEQAAASAMSGQQLFKVDTFVRALDEVNQQLQSRFADQNVEFLRQLSYSTPASLSARENVNCSDVHDICAQYGQKMSCPSYGTSPEPTDRCVLLAPWTMLLKVGWCGINYVWPIYLGNSSPSGYNSLPWAQFGHTHPLYGRVNVTAAFNSDMLFCKKFTCVCRL